MARLKVLNRLLSPWLGRGAIRFSALKLIHWGPTVRAGGLRVCCQVTKICFIRHRIHHNASSTNQNGQGSNDPEPHMLSNLQSAIAICCVQERVLDWYPWYKSQGTIHSLMRAKPWNQNLVVPLPAPGCYQSSFPKYPPQLIVFQEKRTWLPPRLWKPSSLRFVWQTHQSGNLGTQSWGALRMNPRGIEKAKLPQISSATLLQPRYLIFGRRSIRTHRWHWFLWIWDQAWKHVFLLTLVFGFPSQAFNFQIDVLLNLQLLAFPKRSHHQCDFQILGGSTSNYNLRSTLEPPPPRTFRPTIPSQKSSLVEMSMPFRLRHCNCLDKSTVHLWNAGHLRPAEISLKSHGRKRSGWEKILQRVGQTNSTSFPTIVTFKNSSHCYMHRSALPRLSISLEPFGFIPLLSAPASKWHFFRTSSVHVAKSTLAPGFSLDLRAFLGRCKTFWALSLLCCFEGLSDSPPCALDKIG